MAVKRIVASRQAPALALAARTHAYAAGKAATAPHAFFPAKPTVVKAQQRQHQRPWFAAGEDVEVRRKFPQVSGKRQLVIYTRAKVVSASVGTDSYLVQYPAASSIPCHTARVPAWDVRAARRVPTSPESSVDAARPASSKRPPPSDQSERGADDACKKAKIRTGKGIPMDALRRFFAEHQKEEEAKWKKEDHDAEFLAPKLQPKTIKMDDEDTLFSFLFSGSSSFRCLFS